ncbi:MAG: fold metallo-hydrolase [Chloroflexi bacterium]|nr:fold metallo-hydrolase [Chloroflexota bacterium]
MAPESRNDLPLTIDLQFLDQPGVVAAFLLRAPGDTALIEVGPASTLNTLLKAIADAGVELDEIRHLLVTHVHLDHAGAAGALLQLMPNAKLYVHELGAPHLIDPSKLIASATRIYGGLMKRLWGEIVPVPEDRVVVLHDDELLEVAGRRLHVLYTPGHANHHVAFHDLDEGAVYVGDVAGVRMQDCGYVRPPTPPPDLDLEAWEASLDRLAALNPTAFYVTHFGRATGTLDHLQQLRVRLRAWERLVLEGMRAGQDRAAIALTMQRSGDEELALLVSPEVIRRYEAASGYTMNVSGYERYLRKRHPELALPASSL